TAVVAVAAITSIPADADALSGCPSSSARANRVDDACHFVSGHAWILYRHAALFRNRIAVADAACVDANPHRARTWLRNRALHDLKRSLRLCYLYCAHSLQHIATFS